MPGNKANFQEKSGYVVLLDLQESTFLWDRRADLAKEVVDNFQKLVNAKMQKFCGYKINFTGDGFMLAFSSPEYAIDFCAALIIQWEEQRKQFARRIIPQIENFLIIRSGIDFGKYYKWGKQFVGSPLNRSQRCEAFSKDYYRTEGICSDLPSHFKIFITQNMKSLLTNSDDYNCSVQIPAELLGIRDLDPKTNQYIQAKSFIYAIWPKIGERKKTRPLSAKRSQQVANVLSITAVADRLIEEADKYIAIAQGKLDRTSMSLIKTALEDYEKASKQKNLPRKSHASVMAKWANALHSIAERMPPDKKKGNLARAINLYSSASSIFKHENSYGDYAMTQNNLGNALINQAELLSGEAKKSKLEEAIRAYGEALKFYTRENSPAYYAMVQNNLGTALINSAELLFDEAKKSKLEEAIKAYGEALKFYTRENSPADYATTQNNLGIALGKQAEFLSDEAKKSKLEQAIKAYGEALRYYTSEHSPADYAMTQNNMGTALGKQAELLSEEAKESKLEEAIKAYGEALRFRTAENSPADYATTQNNLGTALGNHAELLSGEAKKSKLEEAINAYKEALRFRTPEHSPENYATTQNNLGVALGNQAEFLSDEAKKSKLEEAIKAYGEALRYYTSEHSRADYAMTQNNMGIALAEEAGLLSDESKEAKIFEAETAFKESLKIYKPDIYPSQNKGILKNLQKLEELRTKP